MTQAITQADIEANKAAITVARETEAATECRSSGHVAPRVSGLTLRQPKFDWKAQGKYYKLNNFQKLKKLIFLNSYSIEKRKKSAHDYELAQL